MKKLMKAYCCMSLHKCIPPFTSIWNVHVDLSFAEFATSSLKLHRIYIVLGKKINAMKNLH